MERYKKEIVEMEGFGERSFQNLLASIEKARNVSVAKFVYSLGIPNVGLSNAKLICKRFDGSLDALRAAQREDFLEIPGIGEVIADSVCDFFRKESNCRMVDDLRKEVIFLKEEEGGEILAGKTFVITGTVERFANRKELQDVIEREGGKVSGSVSAKTSYLINNDNLSNSSKNKKAKELGIPILTEEEFLKMLEGGIS